MAQPLSFRNGCVWIPTSWVREGLRLGQGWQESHLLQRTRKEWLALLGPAGYERTPTLFYSQRGMARVRTMVGWGRQVIVGVPLYIQVPRELLADQTNNSKSRWAGLSPPPLPTNPAIALI